MIAFRRMSPERPQAHIQPNGMVGGCRRQHAMPTSCGILSTQAIFAASTNCRGSAAASWRPAAVVSHMGERLGMPDRVIDNPTINSPYRAPKPHFKFDTEAITNEVARRRRPSSYYVPMPRLPKRGAQMEFAECGDVPVRCHFVTKSIAGLRRFTPNVGRES
jgi:hypothetical protein